MPNEPARLKHIGEGCRDMVMLAPKKIRVEEGHNPRNYALPENRAHLDELKGSIKAIGVQQPLAVRWDAGTGEAILVDGECRLIAVLELIAEGHPIVAVPTFQVKAGNEADRLIIAMTANTGKPLSKWEIGTSFQKLIGFGWGVAKIAKTTGYTERFVTESMDLSDASEEIKALLSQQAVTPSLALGALRKNGSSAATVLKAAVEKAKAKAKPGKKVVAKREKKPSAPAKPSPAAISEARDIAISTYQLCNENATATDAENFIAALNKAGVQLSLS